MRRGRPTSLKPTTAFAERLAKLQGKRTLSEFADLLGVHIRTLSNYLYQGVEPPAEFIRRVASKLSRGQAEYLLWGDGEERAEAEIKESLAAYYAERPRLVIEVEGRRPVVVDLKPGVKFRVEK